MCQTISSIAERIWMEAATMRGIWVATDSRKSANLSINMTVSLVRKTASPDTPSSITRLSGPILTRGFASPPHDGFAFVGKALSAVGDADLFLTSNHTQGTLSSFEVGAKRRMGQRKGVGRAC